MFQRASLNRVDGAACINLSTPSYFTNQSTTLAFEDTELEHCASICLVSKVFCQAICRFIKCRLFSRVPFAPLLGLTLTGQGSIGLSGLAHNTQMMLSQDAFLGSSSEDDISFILHCFFHSLKYPFFTNCVLSTKFSHENIMF